MEYFSDCVLLHADAERRTHGAVGDTFASPWTATCGAGDYIQVSKFNRIIDGESSGMVKYDYDIDSSSWGIHQPRYLGRMIIREE